MVFLPFWKISFPPPAAFLVFHSRLFLCPLFKFVSGYKILFSSFPLCFAITQFIFIPMSIYIRKFSPFYLFSLPPVLPFFLLSDCFPLKKITILPLLSQANALFPLFTSARFIHPAVFFPHNPFPCPSIGFSHACIINFLNHFRLSLFKNTNFHPLFKFNPSLCII